MQQIRLPGVESWLTFRINVLDHFRKI